MINKLNTPFYFALTLLIVKYAKNVHIMSCVIFNNGTIILYFYKWRTSSKR